MSQETSIPKRVKEILLISDSNKMICEIDRVVERRVSAVGYDRLTKSEQIFYNIWWLEGEVNNGGFDQYFFNSSSDFAKETNQALVEIGALHTASILQQAMALFPSGQPARNRILRQKQLVSIRRKKGDSFRPFDQEFYRYKDNIAELMVRYVRAHSSEFLDP